ncbi:MAG TPA: hypothetical protein ENJ20_00150, partial [Bacteroidetes bacterium]|nr:hypothetical protein [Bacteroidota bacterium]
MTNTKPLLCSFETLLDETIQKAWGQVAMPAHLSALSEGAVALEQAAAQIGDNCMDALVTKMADTEEKEKFSCYFINFIWADRVKYFLILWRNIRFQHQKAQILFLEKKIPDTTIKTLKDKSLEVVTGAA